MSSFSSTSAGTQVPSGTIINGSNGPNVNDTTSSGLTSPNKRPAQSIGGISPSVNTGNNINNGRASAIKAASNASAAGIGNQQHKESSSAMQDDSAAESSGKGYGESDPDFADDSGSDGDDYDSDNNSAGVKAAPGLFKSENNNNGGNNADANNNLRPNVDVNANNDINSLTNHANALKGKVGQNNATLRKAQKRARVQEHEAKLVAARIQNEILSGGDENLCQFERTSPARLGERCNSRLESGDNMFCKKCSSYIRQMNKRYEQQEEEAAARKKGGLTAEDIAEYKQHVERKKSREMREAEMRLNKKKRDRADRDPDQPQ